MLHAIINAENMIMKSKFLSLAITAILALSFLALIPVAVNPVFASTAPTISPQIGEFFPTQTITLTVTGSADNAGSIQIYNMPGPTCLNVLVDGTPVGAAAPVAAGFYSAAIAVATTSDDTGSFCAVFTDGTTAAVFVSGVTSFTIASAITSMNTNDEHKVSIDLGQSATLTEYPSGGAPPYKYQWYSDAACSVPIVGATSATYKATPAVTTTYSVQTHDSTIGTPNNNSPCEPVTVRVLPTFSGTFTLACAAPCEIDTQVGAPSLSAVITFVGGTGPWYSVTIYSGTDSLCAGDTTKVVSMNDINGTEAILSVPAPSTPSSITYYCAVLSDMSFTPHSISIGPVQINVSPALSAPTLSIYPSSTDYGIITNFPLVTMNDMSATVTWAGGTAPYFVVLTSGSSSNCGAPDNAIVTPIVLFSTGTHWTGALGQPASAYAAFYLAGGYSVYYTTGSTWTGIFPAPASSTYYCAIVFDSSLPAPSQTYTAAGALFTIEGLFATNAPVLSSTAVEVQTPQYEGFPVTASVTWSGGTGPYSVAFYVGAEVGTTCVATGLVAATPGFNPLTGVSKAPASITFLAPNVAGTYCYYAVVTDVNGNSVGGTSVSSTLYTDLSVATALAPGATLTIPSLGIDTGQTATITGAQVTGLAGGNTPYTVTLYFGATAGTCTTKMTSVSGSTGTLTFPDFTSPSTSGVFCATISDASVPASTGKTGTVAWLINSPPTVKITGTKVIDAGTSTTLTAVPSAGTLPYTFQWFIGTTTCAAADAVTSPSASTTYNTGVISTTTVYSVQLVDGSAGTPASIGTACATFTVSTADGPNGVAVATSGLYKGTIFVTNPNSPGVPGNSLSVIDSDSNSVTFDVPLTVTISGGLCNLNPTALATDGKTVYVVGTTTIGSPVTCTVASGAIAWVDIATNTEVYSIAEPFAGPASHPSGLAIDSALNYLYIADSANNKVYVESILGGPMGFPNVINVGPSPMGIAVDQNTHSVYVADNTGNTLTVIQPRANPPYWVVSTVNVGNRPTGVAVDPATDNVYVANSGDGTVSVLNGFTYTLLNSIKVGGSPAGIDIYNGVAYVADGVNKVVAINLTTNTPTSITVGTDPTSVAVDVVDGTVFATNSGANTVSVISLTSGLVIGTIVVP